MAYDSELTRAFDASPISLSQDQQSLILRTKETSTIFWHIVDVLMDPSENVEETNALVLAKWNEILALLNGSAETIR